jgi:hypothetical protein
MSNWNAAFTQQIRTSRRALWGNWGLNSTIKPGAVGTVDPATGEFQYVGMIPDAQIVTEQMSNQWSLESEHVSKQQATIDLDGSAVDPDTGTKITVGTQLTWSMQSAGSLISDFSLAQEDVVGNPGGLAQSQWSWLLAQAQSVGRASNGGVTQGFGIVTDVLWARSGLNVGAQSDNTSFSVSGSASGVNNLVGAQAGGKGSYVSTTENKSVDKHLWPDKASVTVAEPIPIAYGFTSFEGQLIMPNWTSAISSFQLVINNQHGGTYIVKANLSYNTPSGKKSQSVSVSGGLVATIGAIPLDATNLQLDLAFKGVFSDEHKSFKWDTPLGTWYDGARHVDLYGVWPGKTNAVDVEASLTP